MLTESEKIQKKAREELLDLHKRVLLNYLICQGLEYPVYTKFFKLYDHYINIGNIQDFFFCPCRIFVRALLLDKLDQIRGVSTPLGAEFTKRKPRKHVKVIRF